MMRVAAAVLTYQAVTHDRIDDCIATIESLRAGADAVYIVDNGSTDDTVNVLTARYGHVWQNRGTLHTSGHGTNLCARVLAGDGADICVHSDDDVVWRAGWRPQLEAWWAAAPDTLALTGCHIEPDYPWNQAGAVVTYGGVRGIMRASTGAATWTYRRGLFERVADTTHMVGLPQQIQGWGDVPYCQVLRDDLGLGIAQLDLADHVAPERSTWGNATIGRYGNDNRAVLARLGVPS